jgi:Zn-dependent protease
MTVGLPQKSPPISIAAIQATVPGQRRFHVLLLGLAIVIGTWLQTAGPPWVVAIFDHVRLDTVTGVAALLSAFLLSIVVHELGHLAAALSLNYEVLGGALGPLRFERWHSRVMFRYAGENWFRCSISAVPRQMNGNWRACTMTVVAAGPAFTLLLLMLAAIGALASHHVWLAEFWSSCAEVNFFLFILGLIPNGRFAPARNDAALFLALMQDSTEAFDLLTCHKAIALPLRGIRPADFPEPLMVRLATFSGRPYTNLMVARRMVEWAIDSGDLTLAGIWDRYALENSEKCSARERNVALAESACFDVLTDDLPSACRKFAQLDLHTLFPPVLAERAKAARFVASGLPARAPTHILRAQYALPLGVGYYDYQRMLLGKLHDQALYRCRRAASA